MRSSWGYLARLVDELLAWEQETDHVANGDRRRSSLRRWLRELEACGLVRATIVYDDEGQERGVDVELLAVPELDAEQLERAAARLARWRARYGDGDAARRPPLGRDPRPHRAAAPRDRGALRAPPPRPSRCSGHFWPPPSGRRWRRTGTSNVSW